MGPGKLEGDRVAVNVGDEPQLHRPDSVCHNSHAGNGEETHEDRLSHTLPTEDPDLAFIVKTWDRLADECKRG